MSRIEPGDVRRLEVTIQNIDGEADDPTGLTFTMNEPDGTATSYEYNTDPDLVSDSAGVYHVDWAITQAGTHKYKWKSEGENAAVAEGYFISHALTVVDA